MKKTTTMALVVCTAASAACTAAPPIETITRSEGTVTVTSTRDSAGIHTSLRGLADGVEHATLDWSAATRVLSWKTDHIPAGTKDLPPATLVDHARLAFEFWKEDASFAAAQAKSAGSGGVRPRDLCVEGTSCSDSFQTSFGSCQICTIYDGTCSGPVSLLDCDVLATQSVDDSSGCSSDDDCWGICPTVGVCNAGRCECIAE